MSLLTKEQLEQIATVFGLVEMDSLPVRDGYVNSASKVWWRSVDGPELVDAIYDWKNIREFPEHYQLKEPVFMVKYVDD